MNEAERTIERLTTHEGYEITGYGVYTVATTLPVSMRRVTVEVYPPRLEYGQPIAATVNWGGIGSVAAHDAEAYAFLLVAASELARALGIFPPDELNQRFAQENEAHARKEAAQ